MEVNTGAVGTKENWLSEMNGWDTERATAQEQFDSLVEVINDEDGDWVKA